MDDRSEERPAFGFTIFYQILFAVCLVALLPIGGLWYMGVYETEQEMTASVSRGLIAGADAIAGSVEQWRAMNLRVLEQNAETPAIRSMDARAQNPVLKSLTGTYGWVYLAFTVSPDGQNLGRSDGKEPTFYGDREYFRQVMGGEPVGRQLVLGKSSNKPAYILAKPIHDEAGKTVGVIAIAMSLEDLSRTVTATRIGKTGYAILLDDQNRVIAHGDGSVSSALQDSSRHPALAQRAGSGLATVLDEHGRQIVTYHLTLSQGWKLIVQQDVDEAYAKVRQAQQKALLLLLVTLVAVLIVALLLAKRLSTPIRRLTAVADEISRGNLEAEITETGRRDEIGALAKAIERMRISLRMAFDRLRKR